MATNFQKISAEFEINGAVRGYPEEEAWMDESDAPCYCGRIAMPQNMAGDTIGKYLRSAQRQTIGVVLTSVTEKDQNHKEVIAEAKKMKGVTINKARSTNHGGYPVWLIVMAGTGKK